MENEKAKATSLEAVLQQKLGSSNQTQNEVRTSDGIILAKKNEKEHFDKGQRIEDGTKTISHLTCGCEYKNQLTVRFPPNSDSIYCERCRYRCFRCKTPSIINKSFPLNGHLYCFRHFSFALLYFIGCAIVRVITRLLTWLDRIG